MLIRSFPASIRQQALNQIQKSIPSYRLIQEGCSMLFSHRFGSVETLSRARYWMTRLGFEIAPANPNSHDVSRLSFNIDFSQASAALALIDSIEATDPDGWPGITSPSKKFRSEKSHVSPSLEVIPHDPERTPIHWHRRDDSSSADPVSSKVCEYMLSRWE
jgi:hypothetical protein